MTNPQQILVTGGTGFIGRRLVGHLLQNGHRVTILSRNPSGSGNHPNLSYAKWDIKNQFIEPWAIETADSIIHLAGAGVVDKPWTKAYKQEIIDSRVNSSRLLINSIRSKPHHVRNFISSSAIGWYGPDHDPVKQFIETDPASEEFLGYSCRLWEESVDEAASLGIRVCKLRTGIVLGHGGGALTEFRKPLRMGVAAILGSGKQVVSWIHIDDLCRMFLHCISHEGLQGAYNAVAPSPVSNKELTIELARAFRGKFFIPMHVPAFVLKMMMGQRSIEVLKSATVSAEKIKGTGFTFQYPSIQSAMEALAKDPINRV